MQTKYTGLKGLVYFVIKNIQKNEKYSVRTGELTGELQLGCVTGYQVIRVIRKKPIRSNSNLALLGKIDYWICSIRNNRFVNLHSEVIRYSSSASTIRPLFEYLFMTISGYAFTILHVQ